jgi:hypothetical protein
VKIHQIVQYTHTYCVIHTHTHTYIYSSICIIYIFLHIYRSYALIKLFLTAWSSRPFSLSGFSSSLSWQSKLFSCGSLNILQCLVWSSALSSQRAHNLPSKLCRSRAGLSMARWRVVPADNMDSHSA